ncbi:hypothetical protein [Streptomyces scopuliridis]|uniref:hypothetical protein n=1 Tax=Streptomyces scopuliridis TaxID=452529 RepID=UPI0036B41BE1
MSWPQAIGPLLHEQGLLGEGTGRALIYHATERDRLTHAELEELHALTTFTLAQGLAHHRCRRRTP